jgi:peptidoglycan/xylan/chitin deacetylase (PgdA/CDA1 family)
MEYLRQNQIEVVSMEKALHLISHEDVSKNRYACITFDDGYLDNFDNAWQILKQYEYSAHFFIVTDFIGRNVNYSIDRKEYPRCYMDIDHIKQFIKEGGSIGSHGKDHSKMTKLDLKSAIYQAEKSKDTLQTITGKDISTFAYPSAQYNKISIEALKSTGYSHAFGVGFGCVKLLNGDIRYRISRNCLLNNHKKENLLTIKGCYDWAKGYSYAKGLLWETRKS